MPSPHCWSRSRPARCCFLPKTYHSNPRPFVHSSTAEVQRIQAANVCQDRQGCPSPFVAPAACVMPVTRAAEPPCLQDPRWLTPATLSSPAALWEVRMRVNGRRFCIASRTHACLQHLGWPAPTPSKLCSVGVQPWDGAEVQWDYVNWTHEPQSVDGAIYRCCALWHMRCHYHACCAHKLTVHAALPQETKSQTISRRAGVASLAQ